MSFMSLLKGNQFLFFDCNNCHSYEWHIVLNSQFDGIVEIELWSFVDT